MATLPPSYTSSASMSRSRTSPVDPESTAQAMLRSTLSRNPSSTSSSATTLRSLPPYTDAPRASAGSVGAGPDPSTARLATAMRRPSSSAGSSSTLTKSKSSATTSRTRERLRKAESERDAALRAARDERGIAERLKRERDGSGSGLSAAEAKLRMLELHDDARKAGAASPRRSTAGLFKTACSTDLLFLIDTTSSMTGHINAAKEQVKSIVNDITLAFLNEAEVRIAVVGYKDHGDGHGSIQFLDFTSYVNDVRAFLDQLHATGGADIPEDVLGGIQRALNASWRQQTRCIIHIADAPPHGRTLHDLPDASDNYPNPGSEPHRLTHEPLLKQMVRLNINYALLRINSNTDRMAFVFFQIYAAASAAGKLHGSNMYYFQACNIAADMRRGSSRRSAQASLQFEETELGTTYSALRHLVLKSVTTSASRTAVRLSARPSKAGAGKKLGGGLTAIGEDEDDAADDVRLETVPPQWNTRGWLNETLVVEGFSPDVVVHGASTLNDMMTHDDHIKMSITELTIHKRSRPFAQGAMRVASYARMATSTNRFVVKSFKRDGKLLAHLAEDMRGQALCKAFALEFNALSGEEHAIDFIVTTCLKGKSGTASGDECMSLEPFIEGAYVKYNNNCGYVNEDLGADRFNQAAQAFSHFTFERSRGRFMVSDLQGVGHVLTDPAIHTKDVERFKLTDTNLNSEGFKFFFVSHMCNGICSKLGLKSNATMILSGRYDFRESWPSMDNTVCCSNKLCGRIVRLTRSKKSDTFPGCHWCDTCWPQLQSSMVKWICVAPGPHHEFDVSKFFYESQGRITPLRCPTHRDGEEAATILRPAVVGGSFWTRLKHAKKKSGTRG